MLIPVFAVRLLLVDPLAQVLEQAKFFPRAVTHATAIFHLISQQSFDEYPQAAP